MAASPRCNCHALGSTNGQCDIRTGQCECQPGVAGQHCDRCEVNHFGFGSEGCKRKSERLERGRWQGCCTASLAFAFLLSLGRYFHTSLFITAEVGTLMSTPCMVKFDLCTIAYPLFLLLNFFNWGQEELQHFRYPLLLGANTFSESCPATVLFPNVKSLCTTTLQMA